MERSSLSFYERLARWQWPRSYRGKFLLVAFVGTHVPLLAVTGYAFLAFGSFAKWPVLGVLLLATVVGVIATFVGMHYLLQPIPYTAQALKRYAEEGALPNLPTGHDDEAGRLMHDTQSALNRLDALAQFRDRLFGTVVHDLRSPATSVLLATEALADTLDEALGDTQEREESRELLDMISRATHQQLAFSRMLLRQMRRDTFRLDAQPETVHVADLVERAVEESRLVAARRGVDFRVETDGAPDTLKTDPRLAYQVLQNVVANAVAFSPEGASVTVRAFGDEDRITVSVRDEGEGMTQEEQETLFEAFQTGPARRQQADDEAPRDAEAASNAQTQTGGGFGLGLWIAQTFAKLLGGSITVESAPGEGSTFAVHLPRDTHQDVALSSAPDENTADSPNASARR